MSGHISRQLAGRYYKVATTSADLNASPKDYVVAALHMLALAISGLAASKREELLRAIERDGALREAVRMNTRQHPQGPYGTRH
jgi:hypothetical protein